MNSYLTFLAKELEMNTENVAAVVITGFVVVFIGLILLILFVYLLGSFFTRKNNKKLRNQKKEVKTQAVTPKISAPTDVPSVEDGIDDEVVAVIAAAISAMSAQSGKKLAIKSIKASKPQRNPWAAAGLMDNTRPFF